VLILIWNHETLWLLPTITGVVYDLGQGIPRNRELAMFYYEQAAAQNQPNAMFNLGTIQCAIQLVEICVLVLIQWVQMHIVGFMHDSDPTSANYAEARRYYQMAAEYPHAAAWYDMQTH
jgi:TPR repeat protein